MEAGDYDEITGEMVMFAAVDSGVVVVVEDVERTQDLGVTTLLPSCEEGAVGGDELEVAEAGRRLSGGYGQEAENGTRPAPRVSDNRLASWCAIIVPSGALVEDVPHVLWCRVGASMLFGGHSLLDVGSGPGRKIAQ